MKTGFQVVTALGLVFLLLSVVGVLTAGWERPRPQVTQNGYRGLGMQQLQNMRLYAAKLDANPVPAPQDAAQPGGPNASAAYKNVQVLGDLTENEFNRLMLAITEWVSPEQGCEFCHNVENLADESKPTKAIARRMLQMTKHVNVDWSKHVGETGVTCYTCHRGKPVPQAIWFESPDNAKPTRLAGYRAGQNAASAEVAYSSLPNEPFSAFLEKDGEIRVVGNKALPTKQVRYIKD